jgi:hypothetical protein
VTDNHARRDDPFGPDDGAGQNDGVAPHDGAAPQLGSGFDPARTSRFDPLGLDDAGETTPAGAALHRLAVDNEDVSALGALATSDVLVPDVSDPAKDNGDARVVKLPVAEQPDGRQFVPTFTSERRLVDALPSVGRFRRVPLAVLLRMWPSDELMLAVDPGTAEGITLPAEGIRALASYAD